MAEGGPGPSSMAASPLTPASIKQARVHKRVINLVNPADPTEFSAQSISPNSSVDRSREMRRETTPSPDKMQVQEAAQTFTPLGFNKDGVRGILRPTGTPGSGNGVRFFPKNRFRVITPNQSINPVPSSPAVNIAPPSPASTSFLSQLLAVTMPSLSPLRPLPKEPTEDSIEPDESWEVPGQEGEVSLVASSHASERSHGDLSQQSVEDDSWAGVPQIHSSPLGLTATVPDTSVDGFTSMELPSRDMQLPEDMSDLLTQKFSLPSETASFSISDFSRTNSRSVNTGQPSTTGTFRPFGDNVSFGGSEQSNLSVDSELNDSNPTIRRPLPPVAPSPTPAPSNAALTAAPNTLTPTPSAKAFSSMFADMSAEQAQLSWPLAAQASPFRSEIEVDETAFHSVIYTDISLSKSPAVAAANTPMVATPSVKTPGNITEYFDCETPSPIPSMPSLTLSNATTSTGASSLSFSSSGLVRPAKAMFEAHSAHATALATELGLYRKLAAKLQEEVSERDGALADLNIRVIESELMKGRVEELEEQLRNVKAGPDIASTFSSRKSLSPSPRNAPRTPEHPGNRTTVAEASNRDLEIRLAKSLADQVVLESQLAEMRSEAIRKTSELGRVRNEFQLSEARERDAAVQAQRVSEELRSQLEAVGRRERSLHTQINEAPLYRDEIDLLREQLEQAHDKASESERRLSDMEYVKQEYEEEMSRLKEEVGRLESEREETLAVDGRLREAEQMLEEEKELRRDIEIEITQERHDREEEHHAVVDRLETRVDQERMRRKEAEKEVEAERQDYTELQAEINELRQELEQTKAKLLARLNTPTAAPAEVARLRAESSSKDLEIITLQRRKNELKEDVEMLNIALDSKQQELELIKRKFAVRGVAGATPLGASRRTNLETPATVAQTPRPGQTGMTTRRRSSAAFITPSIVGGSGKMLKGGHGTDLWKGNMAQRTMKKVDEENKPPVDYASVRGSVRRERILA